MDDEIHRDSGERFVLDEIENAVDSLSVAAEFAGRVEPMKWKWVVIGTHHALYSFSVAALSVRGLDSVLVSTRELRKDEWANVFRWARREPGIELSEQERRGLQRKIISFPTALERIRDKEVCAAQTFGAKPVSISEEELKNLIWLTEEARNALIHFVPSELILEIELLRRACLDALRIIEFLVFKSNMLRDTRKSWKPRVETALKKFRESLT